MGQPHSLVIWSALAAAVLLAGAVSAAEAAQLLLNNGLAPPNPANVIDDGRGIDGIRVRNVGCGPASQCDAPGAPTQAAFVDGASAQFLYALDSSSIILSGGNVVGQATAWDSAHLSILGGAVGTAATAFDGGTLEIFGGALNRVIADDEGLAYIYGGQMNRIETLDTSRIVISGSDFAINGSPVGFGDYFAINASLTGTLSSGEALDVVAVSGRHGVTGPFGTLTLIPEPHTAALLALGTLALAVVRQRIS